MKAGGVHRDPRRDYRTAQAARPGETAFQVVVEETDLFIVAGRDLSREATDAVLALRGQIKSRILLQPEFRTSLTPVAVPEDAPEIVRAMAEAAAVCGVGPMAAVAGAIAEAVALSLAPLGPDVLVENGGDLFMCSGSARTVGLLADPASGVRVGLALPASAFPCSLCASSATIGHSVSFGRGDLVVVRAATGALADAAATALANLLKRREDLNRVCAQAEGWKDYGVQGVFAQMDEKIGVWGDMELAAIG